MDICSYAGSDYLIVACYLTKWLEIIKLSSKTSKEVINKLKILFSTHGIPKIIIADICLLAVGNLKLLPINGTFK